MEARGTHKAVPWQRTGGQRACREGGCVTGKGVYPGDRLWNVEEAKPGTAMLFRDVYVRFGLDAVR